MSETQIRKAQLDHRRSYHRNYYHEHKQHSTCQHCGMEYSSVSSLRRHQGRSNKCKVKMLIKEREELRDRLDKAATLLLRV